MTAITVNVGSLLIQPYVLTQLFWILMVNKLVDKPLNHPV